MTADDGADVVVLAPDLPELRMAVEVKVGKIDPRRAVAQLRKYMRGRNCPVGLLVTPEQSWLLYETYESDSDASIREIGVYSTAPLLGLVRTPEDEQTLIAAVEQWLERLAAGSTDAVDEAVREPLSHYILPAVAEGRVASGSLG